MDKILQIVSLQKVIEEGWLTLPSIL